jgi:hypothetical protein
MSSQLMSPASGHAVVPVPSLRSVLLLDSKLGCRGKMDAPTLCTMVWPSYVTSSIPTVI